LLGLRIPSRQTSQKDMDVFYMDRKQFCYYSRGSLMETKAWATKALNRKLISEEGI